MTDVLIIWLNVLGLWLNDGRPSMKAILNTEYDDSAIDNILYEGWDG